MAWPNTKTDNVHRKKMAVERFQKKRLEERASLFDFVLKERFVTTVTVWRDGKWARGGIDEGIWRQISPAKPIFQYRLAIRINHK